MFRSAYAIVEQMRIEDRIKEIDELLERTKAIAKGLNAADPTLIRVKQIEHNLNKSKAALQARWISIEKDEDEKRGYEIREGWFDVEIRNY